MKKILLFTILLAALAFPLKVSAATASFSSTGGGTIYLGNQFNVTISAYGSEAYNAVTVNVNYSNLVFVGASAASGWTGVSGPSNSGNTVSFTGALLGSSATGSRAVLNLTFRAVNYPATGTIHPSGQIALADGSGTKVDGGGNTVTYNIISPPPPPKPAPNAPAVVSTSHPSQDNWYSSKDLQLSWNKEDGVNVFSYIIDDKGDTNPDDEAEGADITLSTSNLIDGTNYFHIKAHNDVGWGAVTHFRINIDSKAPDPFQIAKLDDQTANKYIIFFATNDTPSGVSYFNLIVDGTDLGKQASGYKVEKNVGTVSVTAYDMAGNKTSAELEINPVSAPVAEQTEVAFNFDLKTALITLFVIILLAGLGVGSFMLYKRYYKKSQVKIEVKEEAIKE